MKRKKKAKTVESQQGRNVLLELVSRVTNAARATHTKNGRSKTPLALTHGVRERRENAMAATRRSIIMLAQTTRFPTVVKSMAAFRKWPNVRPTLL